MQYLDYDTNTGELQNWLVCEKRFDARYLGKCEAIFSQGNGYLGVRNALEESYVGETRNMLVAGTFDRADGNEVTELPNLPDVTAVNTYINGFRFHLETGTVCGYSRVLNLKNGETVRHVKWLAPDGSLVQMEFRRFVSLAEGHVMAAQMTVTPLSGNISLCLESGIDGRVSNSGTQHFHDGQCRLYDGKYLQMLSKTMQSGITVAVHCAHLPSRTGDLDIFPTMDRRTLKERFSLTLQQGKSFSLEKISCIHTSRDLAYESRSTGNDEQLKKDGMDALKKACAEGYDTLLKRSAAAWEKYWKISDITVQSKDPHDQLGLRFALYHLNIMAKKGDNRVGIGAKGLSGEGYKGHAFWDTDLFIQPYFTLVHPDVARNLLEYRYRNLESARRKAIQNGYRGAMYPWECAWIDDGEVTPLYVGVDIITGKRAKVLTGVLEHHITADVAYGVWQYYLATGDKDYMERCGYEILLETAAFWGSRAEYKTKLDRYEINDVIGPDEYKEHVNNNAYTNYMAYWNMKLGLQVADVLRRTQPQLWERLDRKIGFSSMQEGIRDACRKLYLPTPNADGIVPQTDEYLSLKPLDLKEYKNKTTVLAITKKFNSDQLNHYMVSKQADLVMLLFLFDNLFNREVGRKNFQFYEEHTLHDSSLSKSVHSIVANKLGMSETAYRLFQEALKIDFGPDMKSSDTGIHSASMGGIWQCAVVGFGGLTIRSDGLHINPDLPECWKQICFSVVWHENLLHITASSDKVELENAGSKSVRLYLFQNCVTISAGKTVIQERSPEQ
jgi:hypothetical glycosyl hydrolase